MCRVMRGPVVVYSWSGLPAFRNDSIPFSTNSGCGDDVSYVGR